ncbi:amino acid transporter arg-13 [Xylona heveae TC161]|uniref:Amino acid transporter arg-13 n=1 Tax=Xylona heveae (strain CBS 132557 / TC161) TaxID=1328760 RepID=A0A165HNQ1_XYLHT|nr:amino acid transporter arg-13 [Xylona heveae TC161]KZF23781.1 amino acid transporter arg-13 [Xylona heveae TC161]
MEAAERPMAVMIEDTISAEKMVGRAESSNQSLEAAKDIVFGSAAGIAGKFVEYPFDTVKVRLQSQPDHQPLRYNGPLDCFRQSFRHDGVRGLYRGISAPLFGAAVETSSLFFSYRLSQDILRATIFPAEQPLPMSALLGCGAASGAFTSILLTPIELVKCKMQVPLTPSAAKLRAPGPLAVIASVYKYQGLGGFWHGQLGTLIRETGGSSAWFGAYEGVTHLFRAYSSAHGNPDASLPIYQQLIAGAAAGISYNFLFYPADTIKSRMQTEDVSLATHGKRTFLGTGKLLWRQQGLGGLYRGCGITVARSAPSSAFIFTIYECLRGAFS